MLVTNFLITLDTSANFIAFNVQVFLSCTLCPDDDDKQCKKKLLNEMQTI